MTNLKKNVKKNPKATIHRFVIERIKSKQNLIIRQKENQLKNTQNCIYKEIQELIIQAESLLYQINCPISPVISEWSKELIISN